MVVDHPFLHLAVEGHAERRGPFLREVADEPGHARQQGEPAGEIGRHPEVGNLIFANGFSGHGFQQGPATGNAVSELIQHGGFRSIDLTRFGYERVARKQPLFEKNII